MPAKVSVQSVSGTKFKQDITAGNHVFHGDEPVDAGGLDTGPTPYEFLLSALGT